MILAQSVNGLLVLRLSSESTCIRRIQVCGKQRSYYSSQQLRYISKTANLYRLTEERNICSVTSVSHEIISADRIALAGLGLVLSKVTHAICKQSGQGPISLLFECGIHDTDTVLPIVRAMATLVVP
ncbi:hypothetical protein AB1N83_001238 [Pleurotus pulmonarius]